MAGTKSSMTPVTHDECPLCRVSVSLRKGGRDRPKHTGFSPAFPSVRGGSSVCCPDVLVTGWLGPSTSCLPCLPWLLRPSHKPPGLNYISNKTSAFDKKMRLTVRCHCESHGRLITYLSDSQAVWIGYVEGGRG